MGCTEQVFMPRPNPAPERPEIDAPVRGNGDGQGDVIDDVIPADLRAVVDLFNRDLREVTFPGVDGAVLRRHADEVRARARDVDRARAALDAALAAFDERTGALAVVASRALAYARIYAADQPALEARIVEIDGPREAPAIAATPPRRGRRAAARPQLPLDGGEITGEPDSTGAPAHPG